MQHTHSQRRGSDIAVLSTRLDNNQIPAIEVKGAGEHGLLFCTPSPHKNGHNYEIIGTTELDTAVDAFESHIDNICSKYGIPYLNGNSNNGNNKAPRFKNYSTKTPKSMKDITDMKHYCESWNLYYAGILAFLHRIK